MPEVKFSKSEETKKKMRLAALRDGRKPPSRKGAKQTIETREKMSLAKRLYWGGEDRSSLKHKIRNCYEYREWRSDIFTRDNFTCQICGNRSNKGNYVYLQADHHPKMFFEILNEYQITNLDEAKVCEELWNLNGGRTLCRECHYIETSRYYSEKRNSKNP